MFIVITYDIGEKRVHKVCKKLKEYLTWTQNSVFEGEISKGKLVKCLAEVETIIDKKEDSIYLYQVENPRNLTKKVLGQEKNLDELFYSSFCSEANKCLN